jgi:hypothetical protein
MLLAVLFACRDPDEPDAAWHGTYAFQYQEAAVVLHGSRTLDADLRVLREHAPAPWTNADGTLADGRRRAQVWGAWGVEHEEATWDPPRDGWVRAERIDRTWDDLGRLERVVTEQLGADGIARLHEDLTDWHDGEGGRTRAITLHVREGVDSGWTSERFEGGRRVLVEALDPEQVVTSRTVFTYDHPVGPDHVSDDGETRIERDYDAAGHLVSEAIDAPGDTNDRQRSETWVGGDRTRIVEVAPTLFGTTSIETTTVSWDDHRPILQETSFVEVESGAPALPLSIPVRLARYDWTWKPARR